MIFSSFLGLLGVGLIWGCTNPFIKTGSKGIKNIKSESIIKKLYLEIKFLITSPSYLIPFLLNQVGSILYIVILQNSNLSVTVPLANSLTFFFTACTGYYLDESMPTRNDVLGAIFVIIGSGVIVYDRLM